MPRRHGTTLSIAVIAGALVACGLPDSEYFGPVPAVRDPHHLRWCNSGEPDNLDPAEGQSTTATPLMHALFDGLTRYGDDGLAEPSLATSWDITPDQRRVTFHLRHDARWSNGRTLTAYDVAYQVVRVLHPITASPNADSLDWVKNNLSYLSGTVRVLLRDRGGLPAGTIVELSVAPDAVPPPDTNLRTASRALALRELGAAPAAAYATVPAATPVTIVELSGRPASPPGPAADRPWAFVYWDRGAGVYGWVPLADLDGEPNAAHRYQVVPVAAKNLPGHDLTADEVAALTAPAPPAPTPITVDGRDLLMLPETLGIRVPDPFTFVIEAADPTPSIVSTSASRAMRPVPREAVARAPRRWAEPGTIVTSGPLHLVAAIPRDRLELVRSPTYWDQADVKLDRLTAYSMDDQAANANTYFAGGCDAVAANNVPQSYLAALSTGNHGKPYRDFTVSPQLGVYFAVINTKRFDNVHLRRALALALDRPRIASFLHGGEIGVASYTPGAPIASLDDADLAACGVTRATPGVALVIERGALCYVPPPGLEYDVAAARAELALARRELGDRFPREIVYKFNLGFEAHKLIAEYMQAQWKQVLGVEVRIESQEWQVFLADTRNLEYQIARMGWIGSAPDPEVEFVRMWRCGAANNRPQWCNRAFDQLLDEAAATIDPKARLAKVRAAEAIMVSEAPIIPIYAYTQKHLIRPYVRGLAQNYIGQPPLWRAWLDPDWRSQP